MSDPARDEAPPDRGDHRYRAVVAYDGAAYHGFAANPGVLTVAGELNRAIGQIVGRELGLACAGRTDAGVHGWGQVISFDAPGSIDPARLRVSVNRMLGPGIVIRHLEVASDDFDARFSATSRTYRYQILNRPTPDPFLHRTTWHVPASLDLVAMSRAGGDLVGEHDFKSFCRKRLITVGGEQVEADLTRRVLSLEWRPATNDIVELWITANAFCHQMVRSITGTLVEVGTGKLASDAMPEILGAGSRQAAGALAPPQGLTLWEVGY